MEGWAGCERVMQGVFDVRAVVRMDGCKRLVLCHWGSGRKHVHRKRAVGGDNFPALERTLPHAGATGIERKLKSRLALAQQFLLLLALADIDGKREKLRGLAGFVRQRRYDLADPDRLAVLVNVSVLNLNGAHFAGAQAPVTIGIAIIGMNEYAEVHTAQLVFGIADDGAESRVALLEPSVPIRHGNAGQGMLIEIAKSRLAPAQSILDPLAIGYVVARGDDAIDSAIGRTQRRDLKIDPSNLTPPTALFQISPYPPPLQPPP